MAKTIKFNLICDDKPIRTIEDLQNNFSIEDVLAYYNNNLLHRWLEVRGYSEELEKVNGIVAKNPIEIIKELTKIFNVVCDDKKVEESVYMLEFLDERQVLYSEYDRQNCKASSIIDDYQAGYRQLVDGILENPHDVARIKANIAEIVNHYGWVFELNHRELFWRLVDKSTLAVMCLLMNKKSRNYLLPVNIKNDKNSDLLDVAIDSDKENIYKKVCKMISKERDTPKSNMGSSSSGSYYGLSALLGFEVLNIVETNNPLDALGDNLCSFAGVTDGYWKDLEPNGKKYMIISIEKGDYVRSSGHVGGDLGYDDILNKFVILDGIDYKSKSAKHKLLYMEV